MFAITTEAAFAAKAAAAPNEKETSAQAKAGVSLIPSPTIATEPSADKQRQEV